MQRRGPDDSATRVVLKLKASAGYVTTDELAEACGGPRRGVPEVIERLRAAGYRIDSVPGEGFRLVTSPDVLTEAEIRPALRSRLLGSAVHVRQSVGSTNDEAFALARAGAPEGTLVIAETQTGGRGRLGRKWESPGGLGLWFSLVLRPETEARRTCLVPLIGAAGIACCLKGAFGIRAAVKWPNDVVVGRRKICGILAETELRAGRPGFVVMGVGLNVLQVRGDFGPEVRETATSIRLETGREVRRAEVLAELLVVLEEKYLRFCREGFAPLRRELLALSPLVGRHAAVRTGRRQVEGTVLDIDEDGALILRTDSGHRLAIVAGDVSLAGEGPAGGRDR